MPEHFHHRTAVRNNRAILHEGIKKGKRNFVHLSWDETAVFACKEQDGKPVVLIVQADRYIEMVSNSICPTMYWLTARLSARLILGP